MDQLGKEWFLDVAAQFNQTEIVRWLCRRCFSGDDQQNYITNSNSGKRLLLNITEKYKNFSCFEEIAPYIYREAINLRLWNAVCLNCNIRTIKILLDKYLLSNRAEQYYIKVTSILQKVIDNLKDTKQQKLSGRGETHPQNIKYELQNVIDTLNIELRKVREKTRFCYKIF